MMASLAALGCVASLLALWFAVSRVERTAIGPAGVFVMLWLFAAGMPLAFWTVTGSFDLVHSSAYLLVAAYAMATAVGAAFAVWVTRFVWPPSAPATPSATVLKRCIWVSFFIGICNPIYIAVVGGDALGTWNLFLLPSLIAEARYLQTWSPPAYMSGVRVFEFVGAALAGFAWAQPELRRKLGFAAYAWVLPAVMSFYIEASRMSLLYPVIFAVASYLASAAYFGSAKSIGVRQVGGRAFLLAALAFPLVHVGYAIRVGAIDLESNKAILDRTVATSFGYMPALGVWLDEGGMGRSERPGLYVLSGVTGALGGPERPQGLYEETVSLDAAGSDGSESNVYTGLRVLIDDFGIAGALIVAAMAAFAAGLSWVSLGTGRIGGYAVVLAYFAYVLCNPATFVFVYNSAIAAVLVTAALIYWAVRTRPAPAAGGEEGE